MPNETLNDLAVEMLDACEGQNAAVSPLNAGMAVALAGRLSSEGVPARWGGLPAAEDAAEAVGALLAAAAFVPAGRVLGGPFPTGPRDSVVAFSSDADAQSKCDAWSDAATGGLLPSGPSPAPGPDAATVISVAAFKGSWAEPFDAYATRPEGFAHSDGVRRVAMMHSTRDAWYAYGSGWKAVHLPYAGGMGFYGLVRDDGVPDPAGLLDLLSGGGPKRHGSVALSLPRHSVETEGLDLMAISVGNDASGMSLDLVARSEGTALTDARHTCRVSTDEEGTVAVAYTEIAYTLTCCIMPQPPFPIEFDRPFAFVVAAGTVPVFVGRVGKPEAA